MIRQIAVYGKGGIGKSTVSAHLSVALANRNRRVLLVGCDPKTDSTFSLLEGGMPTPILDYVSQNRALDPENLGDVIRGGHGGVLCCEAGGPEPGVGCAGRGIIVAIEALERAGATEKLGIDTIVYDVPGDVVCGGFAMPIRKGYAQDVYIVTSPEFSSLYAANNIVRGISRFSSRGGATLGGIVANLRGDATTFAAVESYAEAVGTSVVARIPKDDDIPACEHKGMTLYQARPRSHTIGCFESLAEKVCLPKRTYDGAYLSRDELYRLCAGG